MDSSTVWNNQDPTLSIPSQDDFQQFLDMENMGINNLGGELQFAYQDYGHQQVQGGQLMHQNGDSMGGQDTTMQELMPSMTTTSSHPTIPGTSISGRPSGNDSLSELDAQIQYLQHQRSQQQRHMQEQQRSYYARNQMIPPTPNSVEMHSAGFRPYPPQSDPQQQAIYERYQMQLKESEVSPSPHAQLRFSLTIQYRWHLHLLYRQLLHPLKHTSTYLNTRFRVLTSVP